MLGHLWMLLNDAVVDWHRRPTIGAAAAGRARRAGWLLILVALGTTLGGRSVNAAPPDSPLVTMLVSLPGGEVRPLAAHDSETVTFALADGTLMGVRPTVLDSRPWDRTLLTFFSMGSSTRSTEEIATVEARTNGPAVGVKAVDGLKVAVSTVAMDPVGRATSLLPAAQTTLSR
jgi:hypothetical protein